MKKLQKKKPRVFWRYTKIHHIWEILQVNRMNPIWSNVCKWLKEINNKRIIMQHKECITIND